MKAHKGKPSSVTHPHRIVLDLTEDQKRRLKLLAVAKDMNVMDLLREMLETELAKYPGLSLAQRAAEKLVGKGG